MIFLIVFNFLLWSFCIAWAITLFSDHEIVAGAFLVIFSILPAVMFGYVIHAKCVGNEQVIEYYFPADHYKFEQIVKVTNEKSVIGSDTLVTTKCDTTYRITGVEPIVWDENHYNRKAYSIKEYDNR